MPLWVISLSTSWGTVYYRGRRNDPSLVPFVAAKIAQLRGFTPEDIGKATSENARRLFCIEEGK